MNPLHDRLAVRAGDRCEYCQAPERFFNSDFEVEHVVPVSQGGTDDESNLALACRKCNVHKSARRPVTTSANVGDGIFNPRLMNWSDHFGNNLEAGEIVGLTPTGTLTVAALHMNDARPVLARLTWIEAGKYP